MSVAIPSFATGLSDAKNDKKDLEEELEDVENTINDLQDKSDSVKESLSALDKQLAEYSQKLSDLESDLETKKAELEQNQADLEQAKAVEEDQYQDMKMRIKFLYENGSEAYLEMILESKSFTDLLNKADYVQQMSEYDRNMLLEYQNTKKTIEEKQVQIQTEYAQIEQMQTEITAKKASVETLSAQKKEEMENYQAQIKQSEELVKEYEAEIEAQEALIAKLEAEARRKAEEARKKAEAAKHNSSSGATGSSGSVSASGFTWPVPSITRITSDYGYRTHPITGKYKLHAGIDIGGPVGTTIVAAASGTVIGASYNSSMGNYIIIDHGNSISSVYMHCSSLWVSFGDEVSRGQSIAGMGSTGASTGSHLHFSVRENGSYVNPWKYLK